jgi:hypothetical protein
MTDPIKGPTSEARREKGGARGGAKQMPKIKWSAIEGNGTVIMGVPVGPGDYVGIDTRGTLWLARKLF